MVIVGFSGHISTAYTVDQSVELLKKYAKAENIETTILK
jgi:hypothetical protein